MNYFLMHAFFGTARDDSRINRVWLLLCPSYREDGQMDGLQDERLEEQGAAQELQGAPARVNGD